MKDLRDTFASWLLSRGVQLAQVQHLLGHDLPSTTESYYATWIAGAAPMRPLEQGEVVTDLLADLLGETGPGQGPVVAPLRLVPSSAEPAESA